MIPHENSTIDQQFSNKALLTALILFVKVVKKHDIYRTSWLAPPTVISFIRKWCWVRVCYAIVKQKATYIRLLTMNKFLTQQLIGSRDPFIPPLTRSILRALLMAQLHKLEGGALDGSALPCT